MKRLISLVIAVLCLTVGLACAEEGLLAFEEANYSVLVGKTVKLKPVAQGIDGKLSYTWASSDEAIATVKKDGTVKGKEGGEVTITCTGSTKDGQTYKAACTVNVNIPIKSITASEKSVEIAPAPFGAHYRPGFDITGHYYLYKPEITIEPANASIKTLSWKSSDPTVATVAEDGVICAGYSAGAATITGTATDGSKKSVKIKVTIPKCFVTEDEFTITDHEGADFGYIYASVNGISSYSMSVSSDIVSVYSVTDAEEVDDISMQHIEPLKAGKCTISFKRNGSTIKTIKVKVEHSACYDKVSYPKGDVSEIINDKDGSLGQQMHLEGTIVSVGEDGMITLLCPGEDRQYFAFMPKVKESISPSDTPYIVFGTVSDYMQYTTETGLVYECPVLELGVYGTKEQLTRLLDI